MNKRFLSILAFALVVSLGASVLFYRLLAGRLAAPETNKPPAPTSQIVAAARNLEVGTLIRDTDLKMAPWTGPLPENAIQKREDILGRGVVSAIFQGEPIMSNRLAARGAGAGMASTIPTGMRAVAVRVNDIAGVAGFVTPGMRVDVLVNGMPPGSNSNSNQGTLARTIMQNIQVLSAGQNIQKDAEGKPVQVPVVNLLVTPSQAEELSLASNEARIQLVLRNPLDTEITKTSGSAMAALYTGRKAEAAPEGGRLVRRVIRPVVSPLPVVAKPAPVVVEILQGTARVQAKFEGTREGQP